MKKAQGLPLNTLVIAALAVLVLLIIGYLLVSRSGNLREGLSTCNGQCTNDKQVCASQGKTSIPITNCNDDNDPEPEVPNTGFCCI